MPLFLRAASAVMLLLLFPLLGTAGAVTLTFETEDDFLTPLINGQIVDPAFDGLDLEFGNLVDISSVQLGPNGAGQTHLGVTVFDSSVCPGGPNCGSQDPDLLVGTGNILILQNDDSPSTSTDGTYGEVYDSPNDEASFDDRGAIVFDFVSASFLDSIDLVDINGNVNIDVVMTDGSGKERTYFVPMQWTKDVNVCGGPSVGCIGWHTLDLTTLADQSGEPGAAGADATASEDAGFDPNDVVQLYVAFVGSSPSGGLDNLNFVPEPSTGLLLASGLLGLSTARRRRR